MTDMTEIVTLRVRTGKDEQFMFDSREYTISSKKGLKISRFAALKAIEQNALEWDPGTGRVINSVVYVEDDADTADATPNSALTADEIIAFKNTDGLGDDTILINGAPVKKVTIDFKNKYDSRKANFAENNT